MRKRSYSWTTFEKEDTLKKFLPDNIQTDQHGNYFIKIGESKTVFCSHLDVYSKKYERVFHIIEEGGFITPNGTTVLGGDDKAGMVIMIKMIENKIPGLYYFFRGEEGVTSPTGTWGSRQSLKSNYEKFKDYDRCIAFDRKGLDSIITEQTYIKCCSPEFADELIKEFGKNGLKYQQDPTGWWCDSGVFMDTIPECTNISVGYYNEHT
ncbi:MAG: hypothetical protein R6U20_01615 [Longimonas sp.]|uniref:hypothetical protein n=1 Tax=Longimonas sp. TaxID=2039626 RepID=UPI003976FD89